MEMEMALYRITNEASGEVVELDSAEFCDRFGGGGSSILDDIDERIAEYGFAWLGEDKITFAA